MKDEERYCEICGFNFMSIFSDLNFNDSRGHCKIFICSDCARPIRDYIAREKLIKEALKAKSELADIKRALAPILAGKESGS